MRPVDADEAKRIAREYLTDPYHVISAVAVLDKTPTLTPPNEPLTLISMSDEIPPDNERVLVYRPCMVDSDTGPYSVQWGWAAKRDGSHWARLPDRRPPEGEEDA